MNIITNDLDQRDFRCCVLVATVTMMVFWPCIYNGFVVFDDDEYVFNNLHVLSGLSSSNFFWAVTDIKTAYWMPLTWISHQIDCQLFKLSPSSHHLTSVWLHATVGGLSYLLARHFRVARTASVVGALLYSLHPTNVEVVAWISERKTTLAMVFVLLATLLHLAWLHNRQRSVWIGAFVCFSAAVMSKPIAVVLPVAFLCLDVLYPRIIADKIGAIEGGVDAAMHTLGGQTRLRALALAYGPYFLVSLAIGMLTLVAQNSLGIVADVVTLPVANRVANAAANYLSYAEMMLAPHGLCCVYPLRPVSNMECVSGIAFVVLMGVLCLKCIDRQPLIATGIIWSALFILLVSGLIQTGYQQRADRYLYMSLVVPCVAFANIAHRLVRYRKLVAFGVVCLLLVEAILTRGQIRTWRTDFTLFQACLDAGYESSVALNNLGAAECRRGNYRRALPLLKRSLAIEPQNSLTLANSGLAELGLGNPRRAALFLREALTIKHDALISAMLGESHILANQHDSGIKAYRDSVTTDPTLVKPLVDLSLLLSSVDKDSLRNPEESRVLAERAMALTNGSSTEAIIAYGAALAATGEFPKAVYQIERARKNAVDLGRIAIVEQLDRMLASYRTGVVLKTNMPLMGKIGS
jgi:protein O-mannosyl-transferase